MKRKELKNPLMYQLIQDRAVHIAINALNKNKIRQPE